MVDVNDKFIKLVELANTWQGEGPDTGRQMMIARFKYCNKHCQYCDTWIKMKTSAEGSYSITDINLSLQKTKGLMITGGEPTMVSGSIDNLSKTLMMLDLCDYQVANIETNGCNLDLLLKHLYNRDHEDGKVIHVMYSPKIFSAEDYSIEFEKAKVALSSSFVYMKIVADRTELTEQYIREVSKMTHNKSKIYLMPLGVTPAEIAKNWDYCINLADDCDLNISTRMHIMNQFT